MTLVVAGPLPGHSSARTVQGSTLNWDKGRGTTRRLPPLNSVSLLDTPLGNRKHPLSLRPGGEPAWGP